MDAKVEGTSNLDSLKWLVVVALVSLGVWGNVHYAAESVLYRAVTLVVLAVVAVLIAVTTEKGASFWNLMKEARVEIRKVVWPTRQETVQTTLVVVVFVMVVGFLLWGIDSGLSWLIQKFIG